MAWFKTIWNNPGPDKDYSWVICFACFWVNFFTGGFRNCQGNLYVIIQNTQNVSRELASWPNTWLSLTASLSALFSGLVNHYFGWRTVLNTLSIIGTIGFIGAFCSPSSIKWINLYQAIIGLAMGPVFPTLVKVSSSFFIKHRSKAQNIFSAGNPLSSIVFPVLLDYVAEEYGLRGSWLVMGALYVQSFVFIAMLRPKTEAQFPKDSANRKIPTRNLLGVNDGKSEDMSSIIEDSFQDEKDSRTVGEYINQLKDLFSNLTFHIFLLATTIDFAVVLIVFFIVIDHGIDSGLEMSNATMLVVTISIGDCIGRIVAGWFIDKEFVSLAKSYALASFCQAIVYVVIAYANSIELLFAACFLNGVTFCFCSGIRTIMTTNLFGLDKAATITGLMVCLLGFFTTLSPLLIGHFREGFGSYRYMFLLFSCISALIVALMITIDYRVRKPNETLKTTKNGIETADFNLME